MSVHHMFLVLNMVKRGHEIPQYWRYQRVVGIPAPPGLPQVLGLYAYAVITSYTMLKRRTDASEMLMFISLAVCSSEWAVKNLVPDFSLPRDEHPGIRKESNAEGSSAKKSESCFKVSKQNLSFFPP